MHRGLLILAAMAAVALPAAERAHAAEVPAILQPADGASLSSPVTIVVAPGEAAPTPKSGDTKSGHKKAGGMKSGGMEMAAGGHLHLLVDSPVPQPGSRVPMDARHIHLMHGETQVKLPLSPGSHTLQLLKGTRDHHVPDKPQVSSIVTITVK